MTNGNAPGADGISADLLQAEKCLTFTILSKFFCEIWISKNMLEDWSDPVGCERGKSVGLEQLVGYKALEPHKQSAQ